MTTDENQLFFLITFCVGALGTRLKLIPSLKVCCHWLQIALGVLYRFDQDQSLFADPV